MTPTPSRPRITLDLSRPQVIAVSLSTLIGIATMFAWLVRMHSDIVRAVDGNTQQGQRNAAALIEQSTALRTELRAQGAIVQQAMERMSVLEARVAIIEATRYSQTDREKLAAMREDIAVLREQLASIKKMLESERK